MLVGPVCLVSLSLPGRDLAFPDGSSSFIYLSMILLVPVVRVAPDSRRHDEFTKLKTFLSPTVCSFSSRYALWLHIQPPLIVVLFVFKRCSST